LIAKRKKQRAKEITTVTGRTREERNLGLVAIESVLVGEDRCKKVEGR